MHVTNQFPPPKIISFGFLFNKPQKDKIVNQIIIDGYIRLILLLYQLSKRSIRPTDITNPAQKKNRASPIAPPVAKKANFLYIISIWEFVINKQAKNLNISILTFRICMGGGGGVNAYFSMPP
jgi:hypothetical protein